MKKLGFFVATVAMLLNSGNVCAQAETEAVATAGTASSAGTIAGVSTGLVVAGGVAVAGIAGAMSASSGETDITGASVHSHSHQ